MDILTDLQNLAIAAHQQTGIPTRYSCFTTELGGHLIYHVGIIIMPHDGEPWSMRGSSSQFLTPGELTLEDLRDQLAAWIPENRKPQEAA